MFSLRVGTELDQFGIAHSRFPCLEFHFPTVNTKNTGMNVKQTRAISVLYLVFLRQEKIKTCSGEIVSLGEFGLADRPCTNKNT